jgi:hypothetical protein
MRLAGTQLAGRCVVAVCRMEELGFVDRLSGGVLRGGVV